MGSGAFCAALPVMNTSTVTSPPSSLHVSTMKHPLASTSCTMFRQTPGLHLNRREVVKSQRPAVAAIMAVEACDDFRRSEFGKWSSGLTSRVHHRSIQAAKQTFSSFDDMIEKCEVPVLVDFYALWCGPCQVMVPILNEVGAALKDKIRVVKIDTEKYPNVASRFNVHALPTLVLFQNGKPIEIIEGVLQGKELIGRVQQALSRSQAKV